MDHLISWAMYFGDPDGNSLEIYWDTRGEPGHPELLQGQNLPLESEDILEVLAGQE